MTGQEEVLVEDWFQQFPSHSMGSIVFGPDGALYASAGIEDIMTKEPQLSARLTGTGAAGGGRLGRMITLLRQSI